ncbi:MAG: hypothetical protein RL641_699 [Candidatus Parcubacteria bacterium]|jgi:hypothetical protein
MILDLGFQPLCDTLLTKEMLGRPELTYPLRMMWCKECTCVQIDYCVDGSVVYHPGYPYRSGISKPLADYQKNIAQSLIKKYGITSKHIAIDIGSNDGTLLGGFKSYGIRILGVEPTNIAKYANKHGILTLQTFFDLETSEMIKKKYGKAKVITTTNVFAHMQEIGEVITGIYNLLEDDGVFISETHYLLDVIQGGQFDTIYHEHLRTYSLQSLIKLFSYYDFTVTDVERGDRYGGNIRVHITKGKGRSVSSRVTDLLKLEKKAGLGKLSTYTAFAERAKNSRADFMDFILKVKKSGKSIVGKSSPGRASTLLNYYGVSKELLPYLAELPTSLKLGMYLPGKHIPVVHEKILQKEQPDYIVILAWHYAEVIIPRLKKAGLKADFVIPLPKLRIVRNSKVKIPKD